MSEYKDPDYHKKYRATHRNKQMAYMKEWSARNKERLLADKKIYYRNNKTQAIKNAAKWRLNNMEKFRATCRRTSMNRSKRPDGIFSRYKADAKRNYRAFELTFEQFNSFWQKDCHYCGRQVEMIGLDRVDNSRGYVIDNVVSCCGMCNRMKYTYTQEQFLNHVRAIASHQLTKQVKEKIPVDNKT